MMRKIKNKIITYGVLFVFIIILGACGKQEGSDGVTYFNHSWNEGKDDDTENLEVSDDELYLIVGMNSVEETMRVYRYTNDMEYQYYYSLDTEFLNKYGDHSSEGSFQVGDVIYIKGTDKYGKVKQVQKAEEVWKYEDIQRFSIDESIGLLKIADEKFALTNSTYVFLGAEKGELKEISTDDILSVVGLGKKILSVKVTTGHGTLKLKNTELFEGSFLQLNTDYFVEITKDMELEVPEGKYTLAVANNGWGGDKKITITRGETLVVDLDKIKGSGPKMGKVQFFVDVEDAEIYIDNKKIDYSSPVEIEYGRHSIAVVSKEYDTWSRTLFVNSAQATIIISLKDEDEADGNTEKVVPKPSTETETETEDDDKKDQDKYGDLFSLSKKELQDYLSTISSLLASINYAKFLDK